MRLSRVGVGVGVVALGALGLLGGCTTTKTEAEGEVKLAKSQARSACEYYPLVVGARWVYDGPPRPPDGQPSELAVTITGERGGFFLDDKNGQLRCDADGLRDGKRVLIQQPLEMGKTWKSVVEVGRTGAEAHGVVREGLEELRRAEVRDELGVRRERRSVDAPLGLPPDHAGREVGHRVGDVGVRQPGLVLTAGRVGEHHPAARDRTRGVGEVVGRDLVAVEEVD